MAEINLIKKDTDLSKIHMINWDVVMGDKPLQVYSLPNHFHSIGGRWGNNDHWCCYRDQQPSYETLMEFEGNVICWGIQLQETNYSKSKWGETSVEAGMTCWITRNGVNFYEIHSRDISYALAQAQVALVSLQEHPMNIAEINWEQQIVGQKIWYHQQPAIIHHVINHSANIYVIPECIDGFSDFASIEDCMDDYRDGCVTDLLSPSITWYRE